MDEAAVFAVEVRCGIAHGGRAMSLPLFSLSPEQGCLSIVTSRRFLRTAVLAISAGFALHACAGAQVGGDNGAGGSGQPPGGGSGGTNISLTSPLSDAGIGLPDVQASKPDLPPCSVAYRQDDAGNYFCCPTPLRILSLGQPASYGSGTGDSTDAFQAFMNGNTNGTATMDMLKTFQHITADLLSNYDLVILQALYTQKPYNPSSDLWAYNDTDAAVLRDWVKNKGGAIVSMSGYFSDTAVEIQPLNELLTGSDHWSGITYNGDDTFANCPNNLCYCTDSSVGFGGWQTDYADSPALTHDLKEVGVFHGRSLTCSGSDCKVFAKDPTAGIVGVAKKIGNGRVYAWGDEWVTYTSQWGLTDTQWDTQHQQDCGGHTAKTLYSLPQFWYNAFRWLVPDNQCFTIIVPPSAPPGQQIIY